MASQPSNADPSPSVGSNGQNSTPAPPETISQGPGTAVTNTSTEKPPPPAPPAATPQGPVTAVTNSSTEKPPAAVPRPGNFPRNASQLTPEQKREIIKGIVTHDGQGLPDIVPQGFKLTFGEVKAICDDPDSRTYPDADGNLDMDWPPYCDLASSRFAQYRLWGLKDNDPWEAGRGAEVTEWKSANDLSSAEQTMLLDIAYIKIKHETDLQGVLPPNFRLKPSEILGILYGSSWPDDEEAARLAITNYIKLSKEAFRTIFRAVSRAEGLNAIREPIKTNLPPGRALPFQELYKMTHPTKWLHDYDKKLALDMRTNINKHVQPAYRHDNYIFQHQEKPNPPPTLHNYHRQVYYGIKHSIQAIINAIKSNSRAYTENKNALAAAVAINVYNKKLEKYNQANNLDLNTGVVRYLDLAQMWLAYEDAKKNNKVETAQKIENSMALFCKNNGLPKWHPYEKEPKDKSKPPEPRLSKSKTAGFGSSVELWGSKAIAYVPLQKTEPWEYCPGYTPNGKKIKYRQCMGSSVNFIVCGPQGWRLTPSGLVGSKLAHLSAENANIPWGRLCQNSHRYKYDVWFMAIAQLDLEKRIRVPNIVVGFVSFIDSDPLTEEKVAFPRIALENFLGRSAAKALISRHITSLAVPLRQALVIGYQKAGTESARLRPLTHKGRVNQEEKLLEGLRNLSVESPEEFKKLTGMLGLVRAD
ncbi:hypothetical protein BDV11DRAFT_213127 [Aspergillus similis]